MAYDVEAWSDLFVARAGAAAALTGLVFVAVSINIERILALPGVPERALQTLLVLLSVVIVSVFGLAPGQSDTAFGVELSASGLRPDERVRSGPLRSPASSASIRSISSSDRWKSKMSKFSSIRSG